MKIFKEYKLIQDLPEIKSGTILHWDYWEERYTELTYIGMNNKPKINYKKDFLDNHPEWFLPVGKAKELYQKFPDDFGSDGDNGHFYFGELRHNKMCRFCWDAHDILSSKEFEKEVTDIFRKLYEKKIKQLLTI